MSAALASTMGNVIEAANSPYPASFDNNPFLFAWALFSRLLSLTLSGATIVRIKARNRRENVAANHPVFYHRMTVTCFLYTALMASLSDVLNFLFWGETSAYWAGIILFTTRLIDANTMVPFLMALFVPVWTRWLRNAGVLRTAPSINLSGMINDVRVTWPTLEIPLRLLLLSAAASAGVTLGKYLYWLEHHALAH